MISFIVIGKNESKSLSTCLKSVFDTIRENALDEYEVFYIDSNSNDESIEIAKSFKNIQIFKIFKNESAAAGRNIGASHAKGEYLFFVDADMILHPCFLTHVINRQKNLMYDFVTGEFIYHLLNSRGEVYKEIPYYTIKVKEKRVLDSNGCFVIKKKVWETIGGMNTKFRGAGSEDYDFFLKGRKMGYKLLRIKNVIAEHYIIPYEKPLRQWKDLFNGRQLLKRSLLWRKNFLNFYMYKLFLRQEYTIMVLLLSSVLSIIFNDPKFLIIYFAALILRSLFKSYKNPVLLFHYLLFNFIRDIGVCAATLLYFPKNEKPLYEEIL